jgi:hypothetical protein
MPRALSRTSRSTALSTEPVVRSSRGDTQFVRRARGAGPAAPVARSAALLRPAVAISPGLGCHCWLALHRATMGLKPSWIRATQLAALRPSANPMRKFGGHVEPLSNGSSSGRHVVISTQSRIVGDRFARAARSAADRTRSPLRTLLTAVPAAVCDVRPRMRHPCVNRAPGDMRKSTTLAEIARSFDMRLARMNDPSRVCRTGKVTGESGLNLS